MEDSKSSFDTTIPLLSSRSLEGSILRACQGVLDLLKTSQDVSNDLGAKFETALKDITNVQIRQLDPADGAFIVDAGVMSLNENDVARLLHYALNDMREQIESGKRIPENEIRSTIEDAISLFALHELRHRTQGIGSFRIVQFLKNMDGREQLGKFDIQADRDAAVALAALRSGSITSQEFLNYYEKALYYSVQYFFKIYPANVDRLDKTCRVAALLFMLVRLQIYISAGSLTVGHPTTTLSVKIATDKRALAIFENDPSQKLLKVANDSCDITNFTENIENGNLDAALTQAYRLAFKLGIY